MSTLYEEDLAYVQAAGFGAMAAAAATQVVAMLVSRGIRKGTVGDVGCGAGVTTRCFLDAGYRVWALEPSPALLRSARAVAPEATFLRQASVYDSDLPASDAIVAIGEPLSYHAPDSDAEACLDTFFSRAAAALRRGGFLAFDLIVRGEPSLTSRTWAAGDDWAVLVEASEDVPLGWLRREIRTFRLVGGAWRHSQETHHVRVFDVDAVLAALTRSGFDAQMAAAYGSYPLAPRRLAFFGERGGTLQP